MTVDPGDRQLGLIVEAPDPRTIDLGRHMGAMAPPPMSVAAPVPAGGWLTYDNITLKDCVPAAAAHYLMAVTILAGDPLVPTIADVMAAYEDPNVGGYVPGNAATDVGSSPLGMMQTWKAVGLAGHKIGAYGTVDLTNADLIRQTVAYLGGAIFDLGLPFAARMMNDTFDVPAGQPLTGNWQPGTWGGHEVVAVGYDTAGNYLVVSWGRLFTLTPAFLAAYGTNCWAVVSADALNPATGATPSGLDVTALNAELAIVTGANVTVASVLPGQRRMYDDIVAANVPTGGDLYAGYDDGRWPDADAIAARFPGVRVLRVTVNPADNEGDVADCETGDMTPADLPGWLTRRRAAGATFLWGYTSLSEWDGCKAACAAAGVWPDAWWIAHYDNDPTIPAGASAKQYATTVTFDASSVLAHIPGFDPPQGAVVPFAINPPVAIGAPVVDWQMTGQYPHAGALFLAEDGAIYAFGAATPVRGCNGQPWFSGRQAAKFDWPTAAEKAAGKTTVVIATSGERYAL